MWDVRIFHTKNDVGNTNFLHIITKKYNALDYKI